ncbi:ATPase [Aureimonas fodinaquatilis]|uniref:ATPase n=1 Tax=Aureimonas fodinaquatilis TaxID=2565783 RepID=A0A5B0DZD0_9HYPH|nr:SRPBCC family protein [Aureimonas fodinaquatilis]KAA0972154.1 ATPase [Aureimonas fodinaquatilis]
MELKFTVSGRISKPVEEVFEAVVAPDRLSQYFTTGGAKGRLETGAEVSWDFHDFPGAFPVHVQEVVQNEKIILQWEADGAPGSWTTVTMTFAALDDGRTLVRISEFGWPDTEAGAKACFGNCEGWTGMLCAMKAWLEYGINLRSGFYK